MPIHPKRPKNVFSRRLIFDPVRCPDWPALGVPRAILKERLTGIPTGVWKTGSDPWTGKNCMVSVGCPPSPIVPEDEGSRPPSCGVASNLGPLYHMGWDFFCLLSRYISTTPQTPGGGGLCFGMQGKLVTNGNNISKKWQQITWVDPPQGRWFVTQISQSL